MRKTVGLVVLVMALVVVAGVFAAPDGPPNWAYGIAADAPPYTPPTQAPARQPGPLPQPNPEDLKVRTVPGSTLTFNLVQVRNGFGPADWFPGDHPTMPDVVEHGRGPDVRACSLCHYPNGKGRPENAGVAGLPVAYFMQQLADFRSGARKSAEPRKGNTALMATIAKGMTDDDMKAAADYFGAMKWTPWVKVVETADVPKTRIAGGLFVSIDGGAREPLGSRIIEVPENGEATEVLRNPRSGFIAYVPIGSIKKGEALVTTGGGRTTRCAVCHGADLTGLGPVPGLAGRSPSYLSRMLYDMQVGARKGVWSDLMRPVVAKLTEDDIISIGAYTASRTP